MPELTHAHVVVSGRVQAVFFRHETRERARARGLSGWVRNLPDGRVEAVFEGPGDEVDEMIAWCREGPPLAQVEGVEVRREDAQGLKDFEIRF
ncbi:MAG: acylphosphatase [Actinomycetota bacterium]